MKNFVYRGLVYPVCVLYTIGDYFNLEEKKRMVSGVFYLQREGLFVLRDNIIAYGDYKRVNLLSEPEPLAKPKIKVVSAELKDAETNEMVMELKVPTAAELDEYFSTIGLKDLGVD